MGAVTLKAGNQNTQCHNAPPLETEETTSVNALGKLASAANLTSIIILVIIIINGKFPSQHNLTRSTICLFAALRPPRGKRSGQGCGSNEEGHWGRDGTQRSCMVTPCTPLMGTAGVQRAAGDPQTSNSRCWGQLPHPHHL